MTGGASEHTGGAGWDGGRRRRSSREEFLLPVKASALLHPNFAWHRDPPPPRLPSSRRRSFPESPGAPPSLPDACTEARPALASVRRRRARHAHSGGRAPGHSRAASCPRRARRQGFPPAPGQRSWQAMPPVTSSDARIYVTATMAFARPYAMGLCMQCMHLGAQ